MTMIFPDHLRDRVVRNHPMKGVTTFRIGGPAEYFLQADSEAVLVDAIKTASVAGMPWFVIGGGSNLVVSDSGMDGLVIHNRTSDTVKIDVAGGIVKASSGEKLGSLVQTSAEKGLSGLETLAGIPGTVGGAIYGNAGAYGKCIADSLVTADLLSPEGTIVTVDKGFFEFDYRTSALKKNRHIVLNATFKLIHACQDELVRTIAKIKEQRHSKHPPRDVGCAGSFFKNLSPLPGESRRRAAGEVLEKAGAKTMSCGGASVYEKHANFIINRGMASALEVRKLAEMLKERVLEMFEIALSEEVLYVGRD